MPWVAPSVAQLSLVQNAAAKEHSTHPFDATLASSLTVPAAPTTSLLLCCTPPPPSLLLSLNTLVRIARCGDRGPLPSSEPPCCPTDSVARRDLVVELERCGLEEAPLIADMMVELR